MIRLPNRRVHAVADGRELVHRTYPMGVQTLCHLQVAEVATTTATWEVTGSECFGRAQDLERELGTTHLPCLREMITLCGLPGGGQRDWK